MNRKYLIVGMSMLVFAVLPISTTAATVPGCVGDACLRVPTVRVMPRPEVRGPVKVQVSPRNYFTVKPAKGTAEVTVAGRRLRVPSR